MAGKKAVRRAASAAGRATSVGICRACHGEIIFDDSRPGLDPTLHTLPRYRDEKTGKLKRPRSPCEEYEKAVRRVERTPPSFFKDEKAARKGARRLDRMGKRWLRGHGALSSGRGSSDEADSDASPADQAALAFA
jgi:hypothetical protein